MTRATVTYFRVRGRFEFPWDMLRYDMAWPVDSDDLRLILRRVGDPGGLLMYVVIKLGCVQVNGPTVKRWESFNWSVVEEV